MQPIISIDHINSFAEEIKAVDPDSIVSITLTDLIENTEEKLEINKKNESKIKEFFEEKFYNNVEERRYSYFTSIMSNSSTSPKLGVDYQKVLNSKIESIKKIKQKYEL
jgi:hypothetical protein